jgi:hypothetical protein
MISTARIRATTLALVWILVAIALASCHRDADPPRLTTGRLEIATDEGPVALEVQVADDEGERERGLMGRRSLAPYDGMAFVWDEPVRTSFWMKDTLIPLSIAFWDAGGRIVSILDMPPCRADPCPTYGPSRPFAGAVEVARGAFVSHGVRVGDTVELVEAT